MSDQETATATAEVDAETYRIAKERLDYGEMTEEIRKLISRIAYGEEMKQRSRLEARIEELTEKRQMHLRKAREHNTKADNLQDRIRDAEHKLSQLSAEEERYEAKLEMLEQRLRDPDGRYFHAYPDLAIVKNLAEEAGKSPEGVIEDLKERNPDIPDYAYEPAPSDAEYQPIGNPRWSGVPEDEVNTPVDEREPINESEGEQ